MKLFESKMGCSGILIKVSSDFNVNGKGALTKWKQIRAFSLFKSLYIYFFKMYILNF